LNGKQALARENGCARSHPNVPARMDSVGRLAGREHVAEAQPAVISFNVGEPDEKTVGQLVE